eukprot:CAMPEP_0198119480 /NCGR_PEP_ID=MMETSP1442-20131203/25796_1 /TAXON_ID= /ORGANISM="Craspedostauros australis, Strain CCMP3328" /LENGTH=74 /DNA_ID=CAMNT_0043777963 /DNA_START=631 /DNA_END=852 /DNA_ORIENTATION=+
MRWFSWLLEVLEAVEERTALSFLRLMDRGLFMTRCLDDVRVVYLLGLHATGALPVPAWKAKGATPTKSASAMGT